MKLQLLGGKYWIQFKSKLLGRDKGDISVQDTWVTLESVITFYRSGNGDLVLCTTGLDKITCADTTVEEFHSMLLNATVL